MKDLLEACKKALVILDHEVPDECDKNEFPELYTEEEPFVCGKCWAVAPLKAAIALAEQISQKGE